MSCVVASINALKAVSTVDLPLGFALIVVDQPAWYMYDPGSVETADNVNVVLPNSGTGRWLRCGNTANIANTASVVSTTSSSTVLNFATSDVLELILNQSTGVVLPANPLRNGKMTLIVTRLSPSSAYNITSWDSRFRFPSSPFSLGGSTSVALLTCVILNNTVYVKDALEYA
jgi:hypothetical protein